MSVIELLAKKLNKSESEVMSFLSDAPKKYRVYKITKRSHGYRVIAQPTKELKDYQRAFLTLYTFPLHESAIAYREGLSIKDNALVHVENQYLLKTDLENFFNSIPPSVFWDSLGSCSGVTPHFSVQDQQWVEKLLFWSPSKKSNGKLVLSVGAPSSPMISNFCLFEFDLSLSSLCKKQAISYTRYADDLTFSTDEKDVLYTMIPSVKNVLFNNFKDHLKVNNSKTVFSSRAHNRHITGVTLNNEGQLSIGRERKRYIKHLVHQFKYNELDSSDISYLQGLLSFAKHIEPVFIERLKIKYSNALIQCIYEANHE
ncbi:retron St85 family RNA-directed DNA polymerase [Moritella yayanosii]|uniref:RNA-directed DNA polymerase n=1 Tax=Moritella yayanosii TaxID=69539 RepID=A0A330LPU8_9GAMM|nr:retron St85 family RNA-directed DNA polymerase [Moritella yayanosii]SQD78216.1 Reverse transcriptase [Moritella yayanosii]